MFISEPALELALVGDHRLWPERKMRHAGMLNALGNFLNDENCRPTEEEPSADGAAMR